MAEPDELYIGYLDRAPPGVGRFLRRRVPVLLLLGPVVALVLLAGQSRFAVAAFEFGHPRAFSGVVQAWPAPTLVVDRPGAAGDRAAVSRYLLVGEGKHGAAVAGLDGHRVSLEGTLVYRQDQTMLEVVGGSVQDAGPAAAPGAAPVDLGEVTVTGEIVDSKCFLGVMKPGELKPHRACATRCISGGIPPVLLVRQPDGTARHLLLVGAAGEAVGPRVLDRIAEPLEITGRLSRTGDQLVLAADPATYRRRP